MGIRTNPSRPSHGEDPSEVQARVRASFLSSGTRTRSGAEDGATNAGRWHASEPPPSGVSRGTQAKVRTYFLRLPSSAARAPFEATLRVQPETALTPKALAPVARAQRQGTWATYRPAGSLHQDPLTAVLYQPAGGGVGVSRTAFQTGHPPPLPGVSVLRVLNDCPELPATGASSAGPKLPSPPGVSQ